MTLLGASSAIQRWAVTNLVLAALAIHTNLGGRSSHLITVVHSIFDKTESIYTHGCSLSYLIINHVIKVLPVLPTRRTHPTLPDHPDHPDHLDHPKSNPDHLKSTPNLLKIAHHQNSQ